jgi:hypothetical protein
LQLNDATGSSIIQGTGSSIVLQGTNTLTNTGSATAISQSGTGNLEVLEVSGSSTFENNTTLRNLKLTGGVVGSPTVVTLNAALTIENGGAITSADYDLNWIFNNGHLITQNIGLTDVIFPIGASTTDNSSRAIKVKSKGTTGSGGAVSIMAPLEPGDLATETISIKPSSVRSLTLTGLFENFGKSADADTLAANETKSFEVALLDNITPVGGTVSINDNAPTAYKTSVSVSFSGTDLVGITSYKIKEGATEPTTWNAIDSIKELNDNETFTLSSGDGSKTIYVFF